MERKLEYLFYAQPSGLPSVAVPADWQGQNNVASVVSRIVNPGGVYTLMARPIDGWRPTSVELAGFRWQLFGAGFLVLSLVTLANWLGVSRNLARTGFVESERRMNGILMNLPGAAFIYSMAHGQVKPESGDELMLFNKESCRKIWGVDAEQLEADNLSLLIDEDLELAPDLVQAISDSKADMYPWHAVWSILTPEGHRKWLDGRGHPVKQDDGSIQWFCMVVDASVQVVRQQELEQQRELARKAQKHEAIGQLTGGVAHDSNNLLAIIMGNMELLQGEVSDQKHLQRIEACIRATKRGAKLTRNMLAFCTKV